MSGDGDSADSARRLQAVMHALAAMARRSARSQADFEAALRKAGLEVIEPERGEIIAQLATLGLVETVIPLSDGAVLLTVTPKGFQATRHWL